MTGSGATRHAIAGGGLIAPLIRPGCGPLGAVLIKGELLPPGAPDREKIGEASFS